jgi:ribosomal protein S27AE
VTKGSLSAGADLGKVYGDATRCPACGAFAAVVPSPEHRWVCGVCGAPRVQMPEGHDLPEESNVAIREAANAQRAAALQRLTVWACGLPAALTLLLAIVLAPASFLAGGVLVASGIVLALLSSRASRRAATERKRARSAAERAYEAAVGALAKGRTPAEIAAALHISEADVEAMLTMISAQAQVRVVVDPLAALPEPEPEAKARAEAEAQAEAEARAEAEADAAAAAKDKS